MRRSTGRALFAAAAVAASGWGAFACLPDLVLAQSDAGIDAAPQGPVCGDGVIDVDAGEDCDPGAAAGPVCAGCRMQCDGGLLDPVSRHCYLPVQYTSSLDQADETCLSGGGHVVTFASEREFLAVAAFASTDPFWVGLDTNPAQQGYTTSVPLPEPGWSGACPGCYAHVDASAKSLPNEKLTDGGACVTAKKAPSEPWQASPCAGRTRFTVCEREPPGSRAEFCGGGVCFTVAQTFGQKRYVYVPSRASAAEALDTCTNLSGRLFAPDTAEEREQVARELLAASGGGDVDAWIALANDGSGWRWDDGKGRSMPWGLHAFSAEPDPAVRLPARAYLLVRLGQLDSELAHADSALADGGGGQHPFVCQL